MVCACEEKLDLDCVATVGLGRGMDKDTKDLLARIGTRIGMLMEDNADVALTLGRLNETELADAVDKLDDAAKRISALGAALLAMAS